MNNNNQVGKRTSKAEDIFYMNQFYDTNIQSTLTSAEAQVYGAYLRFSNGGKDKAYPSQEKLSANLGLSIRTIARALAVLRDKGYIVMIQRGNDKTSSSRYVVKTPFELGFKVNKDTDTGEAELSVADVKAQAPAPIARKPKPSKAPKTEAIEIPEAPSTNTAIIEANVTPTVTKSKSYRDSVLYPNLTQAQIEDMTALADAVYTQCVLVQDKYIIRKTREQFIDSSLTDANVSYDHKLTSMISFRVSMSAA